MGVGSTSELSRTGTGNSKTNFERAELAFSCRTIESYLGGRCNLNTTRDAFILRAFRRVSSSLLCGLRTHPRKPGSVVQAVHPARKAAAPAPYAWPSALERRVPVAVSTSSVSLLPPFFLSRQSDSILFPLPALPPPSTRSGPPLTRPPKRMLTGRQALPYGLALFLLVAFFTLHSSTPSPPPDFNDLADSPLLHDAVADTPPLPPAPPPVPLSPPRPKTPTVATPLPLPESEVLYAEVVPRLKELVAREIPSYRDSLAKETKRCPVTHRQSNQDQLKGDGKWWATVPSTELAAARSRLARGVVARFGWEVELEGGVQEGEEAAVTQLSDKEWERLFGKGGRGLVFTAGKYVRSLCLLVVSTRTGEADADDA